MDTTRNVAARPFLPPRAAHARLSTRARLMESAVDTGDAAVADMKAVAGAVAIPWLRRLKPGFGRLNLALSHLTYKKALRRFTPGNALEQSVLRWVIQWGEYNLFEQPLRPEDVVVDIGAHIGAFSFVCHAAGSRSIHAFEPWPRNFERLRAHVGSLAGVHLYPDAVFRGDQPAAQLMHSGPVFSNTGAGSVIFGGRMVDLESQHVQPTTVAPAAAVPCASLDSVLARFDRVKVLKLDCEGSEFPILLTSQLLQRVERVVGEYHEVSEALMDQLDPRARLDGIGAYRRQLLQEKLAASGFTVRFTPMSEFLGGFDAVRKS